MSEHSYDWWINAQAGHEVGGPVCPVHDGIANPGFYRRRFKRKVAPGAGTAPLGPWVPVAIFVKDDGELVALIDGEYEDPLKHWLSCCRNHVSEAAYRKAVETGEWDDLDENVKPAPEPVQTTIAPPPIGHNAPADPADAMKDQVETAASGLKDYEKILNDDHAARAQSLRARLLELSREADKQRVAEKEPHLEAGKAVDARWQPIVKRAKAAADAIASALSAFLTEKARAEERERLAAEEAARKAKKPVEPSPAPAPSPSQPTQIKGGYGRAAHVSVVKVVTGVTDWDALWGFLREHPELKAHMQELAQRATDKGHTVPGVTIEEQRKVA